MKVVHKSSVLEGLFLMVLFGLLLGHANAADVFVGSTPGSESISQVLNISPVAEEAIQWEVTLHCDAKTHAPARFTLRCDYLVEATKTANERGKPARFEKEGTWKLTKGTRANPEAVVYELGDLVSLVQVDTNILHVLTPERELMVGTGGFSFTLNRAAAAEEPQPPPPASAQGVSYQLSPLSTGSTVFGVFEGRTPCVGIARELNIKLDAHRMKCKWRVTLLQDAETKAPTTYKVEGSFYRGALREGKWSVIRGMAADPNATVYRLEPARGEHALLLLKGDDNVLFFLDQKRKPLVGHKDFSYTLNRRKS